MFKRSPVEAIEVRIMPLGDPDQDKSKRLSEFNKTAVPTLAEFNSGAFLDILAKVMSAGRPSDLTNKETGLSLYWSSRAWSRALAGSRCFLQRRVENRDVWTRIRALQRGGSSRTVP